MSILTSHMKVIKMSQVGVKGFTIFQKSSTFASSQTFLAFIFHTDLD